MDSQFGCEQEIANIFNLGLYGVVFVCTCVCVCVCGYLFVAAFLSGGE